MRSTVTDWLIVWNFTKIQFPCNVTFWFGARSSIMVTIGLFSIFQPLPKINFTHFILTQKYSKKGVNNNWWFNWGMANCRGMKINLFLCLHKSIVKNWISPFHLDEFSWIGSNSIIMVSVATIIIYNCMQGAVILLSLGAIKIVLAVLFA